MSKDKISALSQFLQISADEIEYKPPDDDYAPDYCKGIFLTTKGSFEVLTEEETREAFEVYARREAEMRIDTYFEDALGEYLKADYQTGSVDRAYKTAKERGEIGREISGYDITTYQQGEYNIFRHSEEDSRTADFIKNLKHEKECLEYE